MSEFKLDFVAVGPQRTGSTWLYQQLSQSLEVCFPKDVKETFFFDRYFSKDLDWYASHFRHQQDGQLLGEVGPTYFNHEDVPERIANNNPNCKILINVRHPIDRVLSLYWHYLSIGKVSGSFNEAIKQEPHIIDAGKYSRHIPTWTTFFGDPNIKILVLDDIKENPEPILQSVSDFLQIQISNRINESKKQVNVATLPKYPFLAKVLTNTSMFLRERRLHKIVEFGKQLGLRRVYSGSKQSFPVPSAEEIKTLYQEFAEDIEFVESALNRKLPQWYVYDKHL